MRIIYHLPHESIYAGRTIYNGYKNAFSRLGHEFIRFTNCEYELFADSKKNKSTIFITSLSHYHLKNLDLSLLRSTKKSGLRILFNTPMWISPLSRMRINESKSLSKDIYLQNIINSKLGDVYYNVYEQDDPRMDGFEKTTGYKHHTIPLAADDSIIFPEYSDKFKADISFIGTYLPEKRPFFEEHVFPLRDQFNLKLYGQDWTFADRMLGWAQRGGQYFNIPYLKSFRKPKLQFEDERRIYNSSLVSINVHEEYQRRFGGDCNERTFKIPLAGGFEITDDVACIRKYFKEDEEIIIAKNKDDWFDKINYYIKNPEKRMNIIEAGKKRVQKEHTYTNRVKTMIEIYNSIK